ncbi:MAG: Uma2 family endonuclease [Anaerolineae bacterium]|nr:Uma2 family endonuclease [Anaerolineae bacterium]
MAVIIRPLTVDDLLRLGSDARVEVVWGEVVEMTPVGGQHVLIVDNIYRMLYATISDHRLGYLFTDNLLYILAEGDDGVRMARSPDVSFIHRDHLVSDWDIERPYPGAPTLAVEVMSPDDQFEDAVQKVADYFAAGTAEVWVVLPRQKTLYRYRRGQSVVETYRAGETLDASELFPGLALALAEVFTLPDLGR